MNPTIEKVIDAYGGESLWKQSKNIEAIISVRGWAFVLKRRPYFDHVHVFMSVDKPYSSITPIGKNKDLTGVLDGNDVRLEDSKGNTISHRANARNYFSLGRRLFYWDDLDMAYFANYALWNYFTLPFLLMNDDIRWTELKPGFLEATFPDNFPTHSRIQQFQFDMKSGMLYKHNYTVDIISQYAKASNVVLQHDKSDGINYPSRRRVTPKKNNSAFYNFPTLIDIDVHSFKLV
jgi:hypothetical protein